MKIISSLNNKNINSHLLRAGLIFSLLSVINFCFVSASGPTNNYFDWESKESQVPINLTVCKSMGTLVDEEYKVVERIFEFEIDDVALNKSSTPSMDDLALKVPSVNASNDEGTCPPISIFPLQGVDGFPQVNEFSTCTTADTVSFLIYNGGTCAISNATVSIELSDGLEYGDFVMSMNPDATVTLLNSSDPQNPVFFIPFIDSTQAVIVNFGLTSNCSIDPSSTDILSFDVEMDYSPVTSDGTVVNCNTNATQIGEYNAGIRIPILNVRSVSPVDLEIGSFNTPYCQTIEVSQDGISAKLSEFVLEARGLSLTSDFTISSVAINDVANVIPNADYTYTAANSILRIDIDDTFFGSNTGSNGDNYFTENERVEVIICYESNSCDDVNQFLDYVAYFECDGVTCYDESAKEGTIQASFSFTADASVTDAQLDQTGAFCGDNLIWSAKISSSNTNIPEGGWQDIIMKWDACSNSNTEVVDVRLGGVSLPFSLEGSNGDSTIVLDLTNNILALGGVQDTDGDGFMDDLESGLDTLVLEVELEVVCATDNEFTCGDYGCSIEKIDFIFKRNCGNDEQDFVNITPPISFDYGEISSTTNDVVPYGPLFVTEQHTSGDCGVWKAMDNGMSLSYEYGFNNIAACGGANIYMRALITASTENIYNHLRYEAGSATFEGVAVAATDTYLLDMNGDTIGLEIIIPAGNSGSATQDYYFNLETTGMCHAPELLVTSLTVIEECPDCSGAPCITVRSCHDLLTYIEWSNVGCVCIGCVMSAGVDVERISYGYADKDLTTPLTKSQIPATDLTRFMPGDTAQINWYITFNDVNQILTPDTRRWEWDLDIEGYTAEIALDNEFASVSQITVKDVDSGLESPLDISAFMDNYDPNANSATQAIVELSNLGRSHEGGYAAEINKGCFDAEQHLRPPSTAFFPFSQFDNRRVDWATGVTYPNAPSGLRSVNGLFHRTEPTPGSSNRNFLGNSSRIQFRFDDCDGSAQGSPAFIEFVEDNDFDNGDTIFITIKVPVVRNPQASLGTNPGLNSSELITFDLDVSTYHYTDMFNCSGESRRHRIATSCRDPRFVIEGYNPEVLDSTIVTVTDCDVMVEHVFYLKDSLPAVSGGVPAWFANEYRAAMAVEFIEPFFPNHLAYVGDMVIEDMNGVQTPIGSQYVIDSEGNIACAEDATNGICCVAESDGALARLRIGDQEYIDAPRNECYRSKSFNKPLIQQTQGDPFPFLVAGGNNECFFKIKYTLKTLCPDDVNSSQFGVNAQFADMYVPDWFNGVRLHREGQVDNNDGFGYLYPRQLGVWDNNGNISSNRRDSVLWPFSVNPDLFGDHPSRQQLNTTTTPDNFDDSAVGNLPTLIASLPNGETLIADLKDMNETIIYEVCAQGAAGSLSNVVTTISVPSSVDLIEVALTSNGTVLPHTFVNDDGTNRTYYVSLADIAAGSCVQLDISTELLFCPVGLDIDTRVCINTVSGCLDASKAALVGSLTEGACAGATNCYEYIKEEAEVQIEWDPNPLGQFGLCDVIDIGVRVKNVKPAALIDLKPMWWFPVGLDFVPNSWQVCYPGGPNNVGACISIPDPTADANKNNSYGTYFEYTDDAIWSSYINSNGLPGIASSLDSNRVQFLFQIESSCDEFVSGSGIWTRIEAADPCESTISSMFSQSNPIIIDNANPADFAQFFAFADPVTANCGTESSMMLSFLNVSSIGESNMTRLCLDIETNEFDYTSGNASWISPAGHVPNITETVNGSITTICMDVPDGIGPNELFQVALDVTVPDNAGCGENLVGLNISSRIEDESCVAQGINCDVFVLNSINPQLSVEFNPPLIIENQQLFVDCSNPDGTIPMCFEMEIINSSPNAYNDNFAVSIIRDLDENGVLDPYDPNVGTITAPVNLMSGEMTTISGCIDVAAAQTCPVFLNVEQATVCECDTKSFYHQTVSPTILDELGDRISLCPSDALNFGTCNDLTYSISPPDGATLTNDGSQVSVSLNAGYGIDSPVILSIESQLGACDANTYDIELYGLDDFEIGPFAAVEMCETDCRTLSLNIPAQYRSSATVLWSPADYLDDPTSMSPKVCQPNSSITYNVSVSFSEGTSTCTFSESYAVNVENVSNTTLTSDLCNTVTAPLGAGIYTWSQVLGNGSTIIMQSGSSESFTAPETGQYFVEYTIPGDVCKTQSNTINIIRCYDYGDLPDTGSGISTLNYETEMLNGGPAHFIVDGLHIGTIVDEEPDGQASMDALGDGIDEDGFSFPNTLDIVPGGTIILPVDVTNSTGSTAHYEIWIDWNGDGDFNDPNEMIADLSDDGMGNFGQTNITVNVPTDATTDQLLGFRARLSHTDNMTPYGEVDSGEVEDYLIELTCEEICLPINVIINRN